MSQTKLSRQQKLILAFIHILKDPSSGDYLIDHWRDYVGIALVRRYVKSYLHPIEMFDRNNVTCSRAASFSRSLRKLKKRGLIELISHRDGTDSFKNTHVKLTREGLKIAKKESVNI